AAAPATHSSIGRPQTGCNTFASEERLRVPWPAAMIRTVRSRAISVSAYPEAVLRSPSCRSGEWCIWLARVALADQDRVRLLAPQLVFRPTRLRTYVRESPSTLHGGSGPEGYCGVVFVQRGAAPTQAATSR